MGQTIERDQTLGKTNQIDALARGVLGALMFSPGLIEAVEIRDVDFPAGCFRQTFSVLSALWEEGRPAEIDPVILAERIGGNGAAAFVASLMDGNIRLDEPVFRGRLAELKRAQVMSRITTRARAGDLNLDDVRLELEELDRLEQAAQAFDPDKVLMTGAEMQALDIHVDWTVDKLIPERSLTLLYGPGGVGKTWLALAIARAVAAGTPFLGLTTKQKPVFYIDRENPWPLLIERVRKMDIRDVRFWHLSFAVQPPKLDAPEWTLYKKLPAGGLVFFDTCRACHDGEENSSMDAAAVMGRLKELRELDNDIILLHHTPRSSERTSKGSTAWEDLADHVLAFHRVRRGSLKEIKEEIDAAEYDPDALYHLGTGKKTRYEPIKLYITANYEIGEFSLAEDPGAAAIDTLAEYIAGEGGGQSQIEIFAWIQENLGGYSHRQKFIALMKRGECEGRWRSHPGFKGAKYYEPPT